MTVDKIGDKTKTMAIDKAINEIELLNKMAKSPRDMTRDWRSDSSAILPNT